MGFGARRGMADGRLAKFRWRPVYLYTFQCRVHDFIWHPIETYLQGV